MEKEQTRGRGVPRRRGQRGNKLKEREGIIPQGQGTSGSPKEKKGGWRVESPNGKGKVESPKGRKGEGGMDPPRNGKGEVPPRERGETPGAR